MSRAWLRHWRLYDPVGKELATLVATRTMMQHLLPEYNRFHECDCVAFDEFGVSIKAADAPKAHAATGESEGA